MSSACSGDIYKHMRLYYECTVIPVPLVAIYTTSALSVFSKTRTNSYMQCQGFQLYCQVHEHAPSLRLILTAATQAGVASVISTATWTALHQDQCLRWSLMMQIVYFPLAVLYTVAVLSFFT